MRSLPSCADILIVGAGPTGVALSAELRRRGLEPLTIEMVAEGANTSRAAVVHARTLEVLEPLGVVPTLLQAGVRVPIFRDRDRILLTLDFTEIPSGTCHSSAQRWRGRSLNSTVVIPRALGKAAASTIPGGARETSGTPPPGVACA